MNKIEKRVSFLYDRQFRNVFLRHIGLKPLVGKRKMCLTQNLKCVKDVCPKKVKQAYIFYLLIDIFRERGRKGITATWRVFDKATSKRPSKHATNAK